MAERAEPFARGCAGPAPLCDVTLVGFDSAWADNPRTPGAICAVSTDQQGTPSFVPPLLVAFDEAATFVETLRISARKILVAIDQPTIVRNQTGMRPCERAVASVMSWSGGGIQPAFRDKATMFGDGAPIWRFLHRLALVDDPEQACHAVAGAFVMEVFPALAILSFDAAFVGPKRGPRYNPARHRTFRQASWQAACAATAKQATSLGFDAVATWCTELDIVERPTKGLQDRLDAVICLLVAATWLRHRERCVMIGDLTRGYIVAPVGLSVRARLVEAARRAGTGSS